MRIARLTWQSILHGVTTDQMLLSRIETNLAADVIALPYKW
jgi:hypothetical protein